MGVDTIEKHSGFNSILGFGDQAFTVIILVLVAGISSHISYGYSTRRARELFIALILVLLVGCQFYHLIFAALYVPATQFSIFNVCYILNRLLLELLLFLLATIPSI